MTTTENAPVLGRPVTGKIQRNTGPRHEQWSTEKFGELLDTVLNIEGVEAVRWTQDTPSWNDGDPCRFSTNEVHVKLAGEEFEEGGEDENGWLSYYSTELNSHAAKDPLEKFEDEMGHFYVFLQETFGDPAEVTATKAGFEVGYYEGGY